MPDAETMFINAYVAALALPDEPTAISLIFFFFVTRQKNKSKPKLFFGTLFTSLYLSMQVLPCLFLALLPSREE